MRKICSKCRNEKDADDFSANAAKDDGLQDWCKGCMRIYRKLSYDPDRKKQLKRRDVLICCQSIDDELERQEQLRLKEIITPIKERHAAIMKRYKKRIKKAKKLALLN